MRSARRGTGQSSSRWDCTALRMAEAAGARVGRRWLVSDRKYTDSDANSSFLARMLSIWSASGVCRAGQLLCVRRAARRSQWRCAWGSMFEDVTTVGATARVAVLAC